MVRSSPYENHVERIDALPLDCDYGVSSGVVAAAGIAEDTRELSPTYAEARASVSEDEEI